MRHLVALTGCLLTLLLVVVSPVSAHSEEPVKPSQKPVLEVAGISASAGEDDPRILYILPWQSPSLPRRPRAELNEQLPELTQPVTATAVENHRLFRETLNPLVLEPMNGLPAQDKP
ncbi:hypothetical protein [Marinobacter sp. MDS2]|uniref:hypothetical protein n=1 Tax=Marinobacter sp. MDS2 TaxID=3065961 RepID=UPI00273CCB44|nr:hypothetical protein [Marinobacter sp. MDS2]MDP4546365.1 hypothetical protein [Marinobacter sp. MDS2]